MLEREARAADVAAGRIGARDRPRRLLEAARVWRELARRTGDATALGRAAASPFTSDQPRPAATPPTARPCANRRRSRLFVRRARKR